MKSPRLAFLIPILVGWSAAPAAFPGSLTAKVIAASDLSPQKEHPDGSVKCPVTGHVLPKGKGVMARALGHNYRVEDAAAVKELETHPEMYLLADGTPKNQ